MSCWWRMCAGTCRIFTVSELKQWTQLQNNSCRKSRRYHFASMLATPVDELNYCKIWRL